MPHKYEREIEEILRNMERTEPRKSIGERVRSFQRPPTPARSRAGMQIGMSGWSERLLVVGIALALLGAIVRFYQQVPSLLAGGIAILALLAIGGGLALAWSERFRGGRPLTTSTAAPRPTATIIDVNSRRHGGPVNTLKTRVRIFRLKLRYMRDKRHE